MKQYILVITALGLAQTPLFAQEWTLTPLNLPSEGSYSATLSANGREFVVGSTNGVYISNDAGATWTLPGLTNGVADVFFFGGGNELYASSLTGEYYLSTNAGATWTLTAPPTNSGWLSGRPESTAPYFPYADMSYIYAWASSADGTKWAGISDFPGSDEYGDALVIGLLYTTADSGGTWNQTLGPTNNMGYTQDYYNVWRSLLSSADGTKLAAGGEAVGDGFLGIEPVSAIYTSTNSGVSWTTHVLPTNAAFCQMIACSADGNLLLVSATYSPSIRTIYRLQSMPTPQLTITSAGTNVLLSWVLPSMPFTLQQSPDLAIWTDVTNTPVLNNTNLHNEIIVPPPANGAAFYRLKL